MINVRQYENIEFPLTDPAAFYKVELEKYRVLIDAGAREELSLDFKPDYVLVTHWHWDHIMGLRSLSGVPVCMGKKTYEILVKEAYVDRFKQVLIAGGLDVSDPNVEMITVVFNERYRRVRDSLLDRNKIYLDFECPLIQENLVQLIDCPGHSVDHVCYLIEDSIFTGDTVLEKTRPTIIDFLDHRKTMIKILSAEWKTLYPGHGKPIKRDRIYGIIEKLTIERCPRIYDIFALVVRKGEVTLDELMRYVYGIGPSIEMFVPLRTLIGYLAELEKFGKVKVDRGSSPWKVYYVG